MSRPLGSICCNWEVEMVDVTDKSGEVVVGKADWFQCGNCNSISKYVNI